MKFVMHLDDNGYSSLCCGLVCSVLVAFPDCKHFLKYISIMKTFRFSLFFVNDN